MTRRKPPEVTRTFTTLADCIFELKDALKFAVKLNLRCVPGLKASIAELEKLKKPK